MGLRHTYLEEDIVRHVGSETGEGLPSGASHTNEEGMGPWLLQDTRDTRHVLNGKPGGGRCGGELVAKCHTVWINSFLSNLKGKEVSWWSHCLNQLNNHHLNMAKLTKKACLPEHDELHWFLAHCVELLKLRLHQNPQLLNVLNLQVGLGEVRLGVAKVAEH